MAKINTSIHKCTAITSSNVSHEIRSQLSQVTLLLSYVMFYYCCVLLWALWLLFNGPHSGMHQETLPAPCIRALTYSPSCTLCNGDTYISSNALFGSVDMPL